MAADRLSLAQAFRRDRVPRRALLHKVVTYSNAALFRKELIVVIAADAVSVTFYVWPQARARMPEDDAG